MKSLVIAAIALAGFATVSAPTGAEAHASNCLPWNGPHCRFAHDVRHHGARLPIQWPRPYPGGHAGWPGGWNGGWSNGGWSGGWQGGGYWPTTGGWSGGWNGGLNGGYIGYPGTGWSGGCVVAQPTGCSNGGVGYPY